MSIHQTPTQFVFLVQTKSLQASINDSEALQRRGFNSERFNLTRSGPRLIRLVPPLAHSTACDKLLVVVQQVTIRVVVNPQKVEVPLG